MNEIWMKNQNSLKNKKLKDEWIYMLCLSSLNEMNLVDHIFVNITMCQIIS
jgi:hypothetical protein